MASAVAGVYSEGLGAMPPVGSRGNPWSGGKGTKPPEAEGNFKTK